jgi:predicted lipid-binding transport protein (Tim44 family)
MHSIWINLRRAAPTVLAATLAVALFSAAAPAPAQTFPKPNSGETARAAGAAALAPSRVSAKEGVAVLAGPATAADLKTARPGPVAAWPFWTGAAALGTALLLAAGVGMRLVWPGAAPSKRAARRTQRLRAIARAEAEEFLGGETWVPGMQRGDAQTQQRHAVTQPVVLARAMPQTQAASGFPRDFDAPAFARDAKLLFMRLTTAWDARDQSELQRLVMPEALAGLVKQIEQACGDSGPVNFLTLEAQVLRLTRSQPESAEDRAEVRFHGLYRVATQAAASPFDCVWSLVNDKGLWRLSAIQGL